MMDKQEWNATIAQLPNPHLLQTWEWGDFKQRETGWTPERLAFRDGSGQTVAAASTLTPITVKYPLGPGSKVIVAMMGRVDETALARALNQDKIAGAAIYPTSHWPVGALVRDRPRDRVAAPRHASLRRAAVRRLGDAERQDCRDGDR